MKLSPDQFWHEQCLLCCICRIQLNQTCYTKNTKVYCKDDYYRDRAELYKMLTNQYDQRRRKGEPFSIRAGKLVCQHDLEKDFYGAAAMHQHHHGAGAGATGGVAGAGGTAGLHPPLHPVHLYGEDDYLLEDGLRTRDGRRGPKRPRTILTSAQRRQFKASFDVSPKPCRKVREALAKDTGLSVRVVQVWFQNQRAKMKKISRKSKSNGNGGDGEKNHSDKDDKSIKLESPSSDHSHYLGLDSSYSSSSQPLNPNLPYSPDFPDNSDASLCSSDISLDENFDNIDETTSDTMSLQNLDLQPSLNGGGGLQGGAHLSNGGANHQQLPHQQQQQQHQPQQLVNHNNNSISNPMAMAAGVAGSI
uniref:Uncharacterized protein n=1 Tax=Anopheles albimanus TaxID=7167 RepID=A0A182FH98_ANOAL